MEKMGKLVYDLVNRFCHSHSYTEVVDKASEYTDMRSFRQHQ